MRERRESITAARRARRAGRRTFSRRLHECGERSPVKTTASPCARGDAQKRRRASLGTFSDARIEGSEAPIEIRDAPITLDEAPSEVREALARIDEDSAANSLDHERVESTETSLEQAQSGRRDARGPRRAALKTRRASSSRWRASVDGSGPGRKPPRARRRGLHAYAEEEGGSERDRVSAGSTRSSTRCRIACASGARRRDGRRSHRRSRVARCRRDGRALSTSARRSGSERADRCGRRDRAGTRPRRRTGW
jgi:hypothetical protein